MEDPKNTETNSSAVQGTREETDPRDTPPEDSATPNQLQEDAAELEDRLDRDLRENAGDEDDAQ